MPKTEWIDVPKCKPGDRTRLRHSSQGVHGSGLADAGALLLNLRHTIQARLEQLESMEVCSSGQTTSDNPVGDITFVYVGRRYKLTIQDRGNLDEMIANA